MPAYSNQLQKVSVINSLKNQDKYFILGNGDYSYSMHDISLSSDRRTIKARLDTLSYDHMMYLNKSRGGIKMYKKSNQNDIKVFSEVHVYIAPDSNIATGNNVLQSGDIQKIEVIQKNKARTIGSYVLPFAIFAGVLVIVSAIVKSDLSFGTIL